MGKILSETLNKLQELKPDCIPKLNMRLEAIFGSAIETDIEKYSSLLNEYIKVLEKAEIETSQDLKDKIPSMELTNILDNPQNFKEFLQNLITDFNLSRIVFLFDEAAHVFSHSQQEKFFTFFKSLRDPKIACKAAVYPGITNYGKYFERGQDAKELKISWNMHSSEDIKYVKSILQRRIQDFDEGYWNKLTANKDIIDTICICSNGNPRFAFHIIDEIENTKGFQSNISTQFLINTIRSVFNIKWKEFETLKQRLIKYSHHIGEAEDMMKEVVIPNLRVWNNKQIEKKRKLSVGFFVSTTAYEGLEKMFSILDYSNIVKIDHSKKSIGHHKYGYYVTLNPSLVFTDLVLKSISELKSTSVAIENNQAYYETTPFIKDISERLSESTEFGCTDSKCDFRTIDENFKFCPKCGSKIKQDEPISLYKILRSHGLSNLSLSSKITNRLNEKFADIGHLYDVEEDEVRMKYIQDVRVKKVKSSVIEYMAG
jgi:hypothetical protein